MPNQRIDRIAEFLRELAVRVESVEKQALRQALSTPEGVDLLEDGLTAASRALTPSRRKRLAAAFARSLVNTDVEHVYRKRLLQIAADLSDPELIMLHGIAMYSRNALDPVFLTRHDAALHGPAFRFDARLEDQPEYARYETLVQNLVSLKLLTPHANATLVGRMTVPPVFREGAPVANYELTPLGRAVIDLMASEDESGSAA